MPLHHRDRAKELLALHQHTRFDEYSHGSPEGATLVLFSL
jgi:hypothetical protein